MASLITIFPDPKTLLPSSTGFIMGISLQEPYPEAADAVLINYENPQNLDIVVKSLLNGLNHSVVGASIVTADAQLPPRLCFRDTVEIFFCLKQDIEARPALGTCDLAALKARGIEIHWTGNLDADVLSHIQKQKMPFKIEDFQELFCEIAMFRQFAKESAGQIGL